MLATRLASSQSLRAFPSSHFQQQPTSVNSIRWVHQHSQKPNKPNDAAQKHTNPGEMPAFSMKDLGASPTVKVVVYAMLTILGTAETITYGTWAYRRWWKVDEEGGEEGSVDS